MVATYLARCRKGRIECEVGTAMLSQIVHERGVALLKRVFDPAELERARRYVFEWGQRAPAQVASERSFHRIDDDPAQSKTRHIFHAFNFLLRDGFIDPDMAAVVRPLFTPMASFQNAVTGNKAGFEPDANGLYLRPQVLHYLSGGGHFASHVHPYLPQRIGLIVAISQRGKDYDTGGTCFELDGQVIDLEGQHDIGDIALFRYDLPHWIKATDPDAPLDWGSPRGRWTMVLPYY